MIGIVEHDHCDALMFHAQISLSEGWRKTWGRCNVFLPQRQEIFQQNFFVVPVGIKVYDRCGVAHAGDGGGVELLVLKKVY